MVAVIFEVKNVDVLRLVGKYPLSTTSAFLSELTIILLHIGWRVLPVWAVICAIIITV